jgi:O-antigen ligase
MNKKNIIVGRFFLTLCLVMYFRPTIFERFEFSNNLINIIFACSAVFLIVDAYFIKKSQISRFLILTLIYYACLAVSTFVNHGSYSRLAMYIIVGITSVIIAEYVINYHFRYSAKLLKFIVWSFTIINIFCLIFIPEGILSTGNLHKPIWFLGQATRFVFFYMPCLLMIFLYDCKYKGEIMPSTYALSFICLLTLISKMAIGGFVGLLLFLPFFVVYKRKKNIIVKPFSLLVIQLVIFFWITYFDFVDRFTYLIVNIMHKDSTLSSRTLIWNVAKKSLEGQELLGLGIMSNEAMKYAFGFVHIHNQFLQIIFNGGIIGLLAFLAMCFYVALNCRKHTDNLLVRVATFSFIAMGTLLLVDTVDGVRNYYIFMLAIAACLADQQRNQYGNLRSNMVDFVSTNDRNRRFKPRSVKPTTTHNKHPIQKFEL